MLGQIEMRSGAKKRDLQFAAHTAATAGATSEVTALHKSAVEGLADYQALALELQDLKRQKTTDDYELQTATQNATSTETAHDLALDAQKYQREFGCVGDGGGDAQGVGFVRGTGREEAARVARGSTQRDRSHE